MQNGFIWSQFLQIHPTKLANALCSTFQQQFSSYFPEFAKNICHIFHPSKNMKLVIEIGHSGGGSGKNVVQN